MISFVLLLAGILSIGWGIGGVIGGITIAGCLWQIKETSIHPMRVFLGWVVAMIGGSIVFFISVIVFTSLMDLIMPSQYWWGWSAVPEVFALCMAGAVIGSIGASQMFAKGELSDRQRE